MTTPNDDPLACIERHIINDGLLSDVEELHLDHKNKGKSFSQPPSFIVMHYTAGPSLQSAIRTLTNPRRRASAHFIIDKDGTIAQLVETGRIAWHAGRSVYNVPIPEHKSAFKRIRGLNRFSIGIEFVNAGKLLRSQSQIGNMGYRTWWGASVNDTDVFIDDDYFIVGKRYEKTTHKSGIAFERYTAEQIESGLSVCQALLDTYNIQDILGHSDIAYPQGRKIDPGPAFPMEKFRNLLFGRADDGPYDET